MGKRVENNDWTDVLRESLQDFGVAPSEGAWERLEADSAARTKKAAAWWPVAAALAAAAVALGLFLFLPSGRDVSVAPVAQVVSEPVERGEEPEAQEEVAGPDAEKAAEAVAESEVAPVSETAPVAHERPVEVAPVRETAPVAHEEAVEVAPVSEKAPPAHERPVEVVPVSETAPAAHEKTVEVAPVSEKAATAHEKPAKEAEENPEEVVVSTSCAYADPFRDQKPVRKKVRRSATFGLNIGTGLVAQASSPAKTAGGTSGGPKKAARRYDISELLQHEAPSTFGMQFIVPLSDRLHLEKGVDLTSMHSSFGKISQDMEFAGLPLRLGYKVLDWGFGELSVNAGALLEGCTRARLMDTDYDESAQWSASAGAIARCHLFGPLHLYAMPQLSYYFTQTTLPTYRSRQPLTFSFSAGISFDL